MASAPAALADVDIIVVRHGERLDEVPDPTIVNNLPHYDPPLTRAGMRQAADAGARLKEEHEQQPFERIYVSPLARTLQTASHVSASLGGVVLRPVPALAECAAAVHKYRLASFDPELKRAQGPHFVTAEQAAFLCADGTRFEPTEARYDEDFEHGLSRLAVEAAAQGLSRILLVSHREGIRDLGNLAGVRGRLKTGYCCIARFRYSPSTRQWTMLAPPSTGGSLQAADKKSLPHARPITQRGPPS